jgi:hypothetical protein
MPDPLDIVPVQRIAPPIHDPMPDAKIPMLFEWAGADADLRRGRSRRTVPRLT